MATPTKEQVEAALAAIRSAYLELRYLPRPVETVEAFIATLEAELMKNNRAFWTDSEKAALKRMWTQQKLGSGKIAAELGISRSAVMGQIGRMGLMGKGGVRVVRRKTKKAGTP